MTNSTKNSNVIPIIIIAILLAAIIASILLRRKRPVIKTNAYIIEKEGNQTCIIPK